MAEPSDRKHADRLDTPERLVEPMPAAVVQSGAVRLHHSASAVKKRRP